MRTIFTITDLKNIVDTIFNGNLWQSKYSNGAIAYTNSNSEPILLTDEDGNATEKDIAQYLNIKFYSWKERLVEKDNSHNNDTPYSVFEDWVESLNFSMDEAYALVEKIDEEVTASQDIDSATITGKITFLIQSNKVANLDYYISKIRNNFLGVPQDIQNSFGDIIKAYIMIGALNYDQEPFMTQLGEAMVVSMNFRIAYLADALSWGDNKIEISFDGDDEYNDGAIVGTTKYLEMPITKATFQAIFTSDPVPTAVRPDLTGFVAKAVSLVKTFTFYDFNKPLSMRINDLFWRTGATKIDGVIVAAGTYPVNIPVYIRITSNGHFYVYRDMIDNMQKSLTNNDFNISSITLKGWGKVE